MLRRAGVNALANFFDYLAIEGGDIVGFAAGHKAIVDDHFLVDPIRAGAFSDRFESRDKKSSFVPPPHRHRSGSWSVANGRDGLARFEKRPHKCSAHSLRRSLSGFMPRQGAIRHRILLPWRRKEECRL